LNPGEIRRLLRRDPFEPSRIGLTRNDAYAARNPDAAAVMKDRPFIASPGGERRTFCPYLHIAAVQSFRVA
jgi:hypothetical protein